MGFWDWLRGEDRTEKVVVKALAKPSVEVAVKKAVAKKGTAKKSASKKPAAKKPASKKPNSKKK